MTNNTVEWCDRCSRLVADEAVQVDRDGTHRCPLCRQPLRTASEEETVALGEPSERAGAPWHFKVLCAGTAGYLVYRVIWIIQRVTHHG